MPQLLNRSIRYMKNVLSTILGRLFPDRYGSVWYQKNGHVTFHLGGFSDGTDSRPEFCARNYHEISSLFDVMDAFDVDATESIEVGCGYGRISPWVADRTANHHGIDPMKK